VTIRSTLLGIWAILWLAALGCWIRSRGSWRLSREGWLFLALGVPFLVAGAFFTTSSYPLEKVVAPPVPVAIAQTPRPAPRPATTPVPETYAQAVNAAQHAAVARYPELGRSGTLFNARFVAAYHRLRRENPSYFVDPEWPLHLADEIARTAVESP
jgi:hypothetical protein